MTSTCYCNLAHPIKIGNKDYLLLELNNLRISFLLRKSSPKKVNDLDIFHELYCEDVYKIKEKEFKNKVIVDIGAHIGIFSLLAIKNSVNNRLYSIEPDKENFLMLKLNKDLNKLNFYIMNKAIAGISGDVFLEKDYYNVGGNRVYTDKKERCKRIKAISLKDLCKFVGGKIDLLKIDCEGSEYDIFAKSSDEDLKNINWILMETHCYDKQSYERKNQLFSRLKNLGFQYKVLKEISYPEEGSFEIVDFRRDIL